MVSMNPTHGSGWTFQIQPTKEGVPGSRNPTNGSWWIVQVRPILLAQEGLARPDHVKIKLDMIQTTKAGLEQSTNYRWWDFRNPFQHSPRRLDLKNPPTSVGGIHASHKLVAHPVEDYD